METVERRLASLVRSAGPVRAAFAEIAWRLVRSRAWEPLCYARPSDYANERIGRSARALQDLACVGRMLGELPHLRRALVDGELGWTRVRLVARVAQPWDEQRWIAYARTRSAAALAREVRQVDVGAVEAGALEADESASRLLEIACTPLVRARWHYATHVARRVHGGRLGVSGCAELIAAEVLSGVPIDPEAESPPQADDPAGVAAKSEPPPSDEPVVGGPLVRILPSPEVAALVRDLDDADAYELDRRLREAVLLEQRLEARIGPLLDAVLARGAHRRLGYATREAYARERLGLDPSWARALLRIERAARTSGAFARAYRRGALTALQAGALVPLVLSDLDESRIVQWMGHARRFTLRRLRDDVERALLVRETEPETWRRTGGLPEEESALEGQPSPEREIGADQSVAAETCTVRMIVDAEVARLWRALLCTIRRRAERRTGRLPSQGEALGIMLDHALGAWGAGKRERRAHAVFARDGWRCAVPGCTSLRNLHDHHIVFRSAGGSDELANRVTLCAFHHLRGVHRGTLGVTGAAPDRLRFTLPLGVYASGDRWLAARTRVPASPDRTRVAS